MIVDAACYEHGQRIPGEFDYETAAFWITQPEIFAWVGLHEPSPEEFDQAVKTFHLHELAVDDTLRAHQRPKLETFDDTLFVVTKPARYADPVEIIEFGEILIFVDPDFAVAVRHGEASRLIEARHKLEADPQRLACGAGSVLHAILHQVVRDYAVVLDEAEPTFGRSRTMSSPPRVTPSASTGSSRRFSASTKRQSPSRNRYTGWPPRTSRPSTRR